MLVFLRCDFIQSISFVHIIATRKTKTTSLCISSPPPFFSPLVNFLASIFPFCFLIPPRSFYLLLIASDSKLPSNNAAMRAAMILPAPGSSDKCYGNFPMEHGKRCGFSPG